MAPLVNGLSRAVLTLDGVQVGDAINFFGNSSLNDAQDVAILVTDEEVAAAAALAAATAIGDAMAAATAADALDAAVAAAPPGMLELVPHAHFNRRAADIARRELGPRTPTHCAVWGGKAGACGNRHR